MREGVNRQVRIGKSEPHSSRSEQSVTQRRQMNLSSAHCLRLNGYTRAARTARSRLSLLLSLILFIPFLAENSTGGFFYRSLFLERHFRRQILLCRTMIVLNACSREPGQ